MPTPYDLSELVPTSGLLADYPLDEITSDDPVATVTDYSGNSRTLSANNDVPVIPAEQTVELDVLNGRPAISHSGDAPLKATGGMNAKHIFMVAKYDLAANFGGTYRGLISDDTSITALVGDNGASSTKFTNLGFGGSYTYTKSQTAYAESNQQAPFSNFELLEITHSTGFSLANLQIGQQTNNTGRRWRGRWTDLKLYSAILTGTNLRKLRLYYDLKFQLFLTSGTTLEFPYPDLTGIYYEHFNDKPQDWPEITDSYTYEDGGRTFNRRSDSTTREWDLRFMRGLSKAQTDIFDAFWDAVGIDRTFSFTDKYGTEWENVRVKNYSRAHEGHRSWDRQAAFTLVKYP